jgi:hypothetical protein
VELSLYKRSFRQRFETSISAGTHDYEFKFPKETWKVGIAGMPRRREAVGAALPFHDIPPPPLERKAFA